MCGGGGSKSQTVYQAQLPGPLTDKMAQTADSAIALSATPFQAYDGQRIAGFNTTQWAALGGAGQQAGYRAPQATVTQAGGRDAVATTGTATDMVGARIDAPTSLEGKDLSGYTNPWEDEVVRTSMSDIDRELFAAQQAAAGNAAMSGAWGGSSAGLQQAALANDALRSKASTIAGLRSTGYGRAQDLASADLSRGLTAAQAQAALDQETAATNAGAANQFGLANMGAQNQFAALNKQSADQFSLANAEAANRGSLANQQASLAEQAVRASGAQQMWGMGSAYQATEQAQMDVNYDEFLRQINDPFQKTQYAIGSLTGVSPNFATSSTTSRTPSPNPWGQAAGVAAIGAGLASFAHGGEVAGLGYSGGGTLPSRRDMRPPPGSAEADVPADPDLAALLEELAVQDVADDIDPAVAAPRLVPRQAGLDAVRPPMTDAEGEGRWAAPAAPQAAPPAAPRAGVPLQAPSQGDVRLSLAMPDQEAPEAAAARQAGLAVDQDTGAPRVAGMTLPAPAPLAMPSPTAYQVRPEGVGQYRSDDPVVQRRISLESGGNPAAMNDRTGAVGLGQYRPDRLVDLGVYQPSEGETWSANGRATRAPWTGRFNIPGHPEVRTVEDLRRSPAAQGVIERRNQEWERRQIQALGLDRYVGQRVAGIDVTDEHLRHAVHFAGPTGAARFFESGGRHNPSDGNLTVSQYITRAAAGGGARGGGAVPDMRSVSARVPVAGLAANDDTVPASGPVQGGGPAQTPVDGEATAGRGIEEQPGWWSRVRAGFRDPSSEGAAGSMGLIAAGLGMLGSRSPHLGTQIGEGGLMGMQFINQARQTRGQEAALAGRTAYQNRMATAAEARARATAAAAERAARDGRLPAGYRWDPANPNRQEAIPGGPADPANQRGPESRVLTPDEAAELGFRPGTVVTVDRDPRTGRDGPPTVRQQPRERQLPAGYEDDGEGGMRRIPGFRQDMPLPPAAVSNLSEVGGRLSAVGRLRTNFADDYAGKGAEFAGTISNWVGRNIGAGYHDQAQWWQDYQGFINEVRHSLFGAALTATEAAQFNRFSVNPGMTPATVRANLARQEDIARTGALRQAAALVSSGYGVESVASATGLGIEDIQRARPHRPRDGDTVPAREEVAPARAAAPPQPGQSVRTAGTGARAPAAAPAPARAANGNAAPVRIRSMEEGMRLPRGTPVLLPDGRRGTAPGPAAAGGGG